jgi:hypothetical protein
VNTSTLAQELAPLDAKIEDTRNKHAALQGELHVVEEELNTYSAERQRFDALRDICNAFDKLTDLKAENLFWEGISQGKVAAEHLERVRSRVSRFEGEISGILEKQKSLQEQINQCLDELDILNDELREAYEREEQRKEEFVIEREPSPIPLHPMIMPWTKELESERRFRRAILVALLLCFLFGTLFSLVTVPLPDRSTTVPQIPERLVQMVKKEPPKPAPVQKTLPKQKEEEVKEAKKESKPKPDQQKPENTPKVAVAENTEAAARKKAEGVGVLKFKNAFADLMKDTPVAKLGTEAHLDNPSPRASGQAVAQRSLVSIQAKDGSSGGIGNAGVSRNIGNGNVNRLASGGNGVGFVRVESNISDLKETSRPLSDGPGPGRTDEEIQIVFDRYKAALYRIYNKELRKDPTLQGKVLMRISIESNGEVSMCKVESTDLASPELVAKIVERIKQFNFGPKEGVPKITILYPIDFLPTG